MKLTCTCGNETDLIHDGYGSPSFGTKALIDIYNLQFTNKLFKVRRRFNLSLKRRLTYVQCLKCGDELLLGTVKARRS